MKVLVACEFSGIVRDAFRALGHDAASCDLLDTESPGLHYKEDIVEVLHKYGPWDLIIAHPPCTYLAVSGNGPHSKSSKREEAVLWTKELWRTMGLYAPRICLENPVGVLSTRWRKPDQYVQPWQFGTLETKKTGLWLHNLPKLEPLVTEKPEGVVDKILAMGPSEDRAKKRSLFFPSIAQQMALQWGSLND